MKGSNIYLQAMHCLKSVFDSRILKGSRAYLQFTKIFLINKIIDKAITSCFYAVKPRVVYNTRVMLPSAKKDSVPTTQKVV